MAKPAVVLLVLLVVVHGRGGRGQGWGHKLTPGRNGGVASQTPAPELDQLVQVVDGLGGAEGGPYGGRSGAHTPARGVADQRGSGVAQVWSLTQFYSVDFSQSRVGVKKCVFDKRTIKVCVSCF